VNGNIIVEEEDDAFVKASWGERIDEGTRTWNYQSMTFAWRLY
jgi:hypothetical protein